MRTLQLAVIGSFLFPSLGAANLVPASNPAPFVEVRLFFSCRGARFIFLVVFVVHLNGLLRRSPCGIRRFCFCMFSIGRKFGRLFRILLHLQRRKFSAGVSLSSCALTAGAV